MISMGSKITLLRGNWILFRQKGILLKLKRNLLRLKRILSRGVLHLSTDGGVLLRFEKLILRWTHFFEKSNPEWDRNFKIFSKFPTFFANFPKKVPYEGLIFLFWCF